MRVYVVMPHYIISEEIKALATQAIKSFQATVISVDDASPLDTSFLKDLSEIYIRNETNSGFAVTCNRGFQWIFDNEPDDCFIVCANNDIKVHEKVIPALQYPFKEWDNVAFTGIISTTGDEIDRTPLKDFSWNQISEGGLLRDRMQDGGLWMSTKSVLQKIGIFDERFLRGGFEDWDLFLRARDTYGMKIIMSGMAAYWHKQGATRWNDLIERESRRIENDNHKRFIEKWGYDPYSRQVWREKLLFNA